MEATLDLSNKENSNGGAVTNLPVVPATSKEPEVSTGKLILEMQKLTVEIREIKARNRTFKRSFFHNEVRTWVALVGGLLTGMGAIATVFIQAGSFLDQRKSESQFKIRAEI